jgi:hypothetical protein
MGPIRACTGKDRKILHCERQVQPGDSFKHIRYLPKYRHKMVKSDELSSLGNKAFVMSGYLGSSGGRRVD